MESKAIDSTLKLERFSSIILSFLFHYAVPFHYIIIYIYFEKGHSNNKKDSLTITVIYGPLSKNYTDSDLFQQSIAEEWNEVASSDSEGSSSRSSSNSGSGRQRSEYVCLFDGRPRNTANIPPQAKPAITPKKNRLHRAKLQLFDRNDKGKHDASSQTDAFAEPVEKCSAAVQCDILQGCNCKKELSFSHGAETVTSTSKVERPLEGRTLQQKVQSSSLQIEMLC